jgi:hypothetical protein
MVGDEWARQRYFVKNVAVGAEVFIWKLHAGAE